MPTFEDHISAQVRELRELVERLSAYDLPTATVARYQTAAGQAIPHATETIINFETKVLDTGALVATGAAWKCTARQAGYYTVHAAILYTNSTAWAVGSKGCQLSLWKNGNLVSTMDRVDSLPAGSTIYAHLHGRDTIYLAAGDYLDVRTQQTTGSSLALTTVPTFCYITVQKL